MNLYRHFRDNLFTPLLQELIKEGKLPEGLNLGKFVVEAPKDVSHGDISTNAAMVLAKDAKLKPLDLAKMIVEKIPAFSLPIENASTAGPGFINLKLKDEFWWQVLAQALVAGKNWGKSNLGQKKKVNVEYVSANPTGPMHVGHGRGAVVGDALASLLAEVGYDVTREYYINDAGAQVLMLARSLHFRYRQALGETLGEMPEGCYPGEYLIPVAAKLVAQDGNKWQNKPEAEWLEPLRAFAVAEMMVLIREDLAALGVKHDVFVSEKQLVEAGEVECAINQLAAQGLIYEGVLEPPKGKLPEDWEQRPQTLFRATDFGDDVDRPLKKSDGTNTYFATDISYHRDKIRRGFAQMIDIWGADHGGYIKRMQAAVKAISGDSAKLEVRLCQMVNLLKNGEPYKMSKRAGTFVTLRDVIDEVGAGVVRFIMLTRKNDAHLDFDLVKVTEQSRDNPVFYVQYAHARACSVMRHAKEMFPQNTLDLEELAKTSLKPLTSDEEIDLMRRIAGWPALLEAAAIAYEPHRLAYYLYDLAGSFHAWWNKGREDAEMRFLIADNPELSKARLALVQGMAMVIANGLGIFGVTPLEEMH